MASEELMFDPSLKKKKKKAVAFTEDPLGADADELEPTNVPPKDLDDDAANDDANMFEGMKKKKKKKVSLEGLDEPAEEANGDDMFEGMKKKKKKKDIPMDLEASPAPEDMEAEPTANGANGEEAVDADLFAGMKKKKKKAIPDDLGDSEPAPAADGVNGATAEDDFDFSDLKKKKKKAKKALDMEAFERELEEANTADRKSKKSKTEDEDEEEGEDDEGELGDDPFARDGEHDTGEGDEKWLGTDRDYTYDELLDRFYRILRQNNPELAGGKRRHTVPPPSVMREGNKKTIFANIVDIAKRIHRSPDHVISFLFAELGTTGSVDGSSRLVIKGRFQQKQLENVLRRYIVEYVTCKTCKSPDTLLEKENRIFFVQCESCGSRRSVSAVKTGFQAQVGKRSKTKAAT
ncbi:hypothetical protein DACRYDRAFT_22599 [Dacryopinax primogenitus]|uniref:Translation initiation factor IF2/IF5 domain-containing protein n=1 Tax=Dacryopinax primogenitus (strain DJM 731) TaxID=1858805 RepID=M5G6M9_DACPD|nr:uncharacterized protein DACRYDRAFT_22599 [Dacryopinax primogenitus]EJU01477.1 hypothetical protein DACRYDRAFT_22599 [Dacryopinax primogenitus]